MHNYAHGILNVTREGIVYYGNYDNAYIILCSLCVMWILFPSSFSLFRMSSYQLTHSFELAFASGQVVAGYRT